MSEHALRIISCIPRELAKNSSRRKPADLIRLDMSEIHVIPWLGLREPFNVFSHLVGAGIFTFLAIRLVPRAQGHPIRTIGLVLLAYTSVQTLICSSVYHMCWPGRVREIMLAVDVAGIFLLIAGSITPVHLILFTGYWRWIPIIVAWLVAVTGAGFKLSSTLSNAGSITTIFFLVIGWANVVTAIKVWHRHGWDFLQYAVFSGMAYTIGATILMMHRPNLVPGVIGPHEIWHLAVLCGLGLHWRFVFQISSPEILLTTVNS